MTTYVTKTKKQNGTITHLLCRFDLSQNSSEFWKTRSDVVVEITNGTLYYTAPWRNGSRVVGAQIILYRGKTGVYLTTRGNEREWDNLDELPSE